MNPQEQKERKGEMRALERTHFYTNESAWGILLLAMMEQQGIRFILPLKTTAKAGKSI